MVLTLGAPGIYRAPEEPDRSYRGVRLDVAGFVGIAPRGPVDEHPVARAVDSWSAYRELYGGFDGPGRLPYAVAAFFEQGGKRAYVVRVAPSRTPNHATHAEPFVAEHVVALPDADPDSIAFAARNEGAWGSKVQLRFGVEVERSFRSDASPAGLTLNDDQVLLADGIEVPIGTLLHVRSDASAHGVLAFVEHLADQTSQRENRVVVLRVASLSATVQALRTPGSDLRVDVLAAKLSVRHAAEAEISEEFQGLGLDPAHPEWMWDAVDRRSRHIRPKPDWRAERLRLWRLPLTPTTSTCTVEGRDRYDEIDVDRDFFDESYDPLLDGDPKPTGRPWRGVHALAGVDELGMVLAPDLFWSGPVAEQAPPSPPAPCRPTFRPCPDPVATPDERPAVGRLLDGSNPDDFRTLLARQQRLVEIAEQWRRLVVLLDVPMRMPVQRIEQWRNAVDSSYVAAYHPWLRSDRADDGRNVAIEVPPSAVAAGIIAAKEHSHGVAWGPANEIAVGVTTLTEHISTELHDRLHPQGINVFRRDPRGIRLSAARTLSRDPTLRQLSVRRLMLLIRLTLLRESQWMAFEPNNETLRASTAWHVRTFLRQLYLGGAFRGDSEDEAFFVHCDGSLNPRGVLDRGQLFIEIGVAPAEPLEFLVVRLALQRDDRVTAEERRV